jgi:hypothetical protein
MYCKHSSRTIKVSKIEYGQQYLELWDMSWWIFIWKIKQSFWQAKEAHEIAGCQGSHIL